MSWGSEAPRAATESRVCRSLRALGGLHESSHERNVWNQCTPAGEQPHSPQLKLCIAVKTQQVKSIKILSLEREAFIERLVHIAH